MFLCVVKFIEICLVFIQQSFSIDLYDYHNSQIIFSRYSSMEEEHNIFGHITHLHTIHAHSIKKIKNKYS